MAIKCLIIDDEPLAIQIIATHLKQIPDLELVKSFQNPMEAFEELKEDEVTMEEIQLIRIKFLSEMAN